MTRHRALTRVLFASFLAGSQLLYAADWRFIVSGDSRNCGDVVMPEIARAVEKHKAEFYWHLGDYRAIYRVDQDYAQTHMIQDPQSKTEIATYQDAAWDDFIEKQLKPFGKTPLFLVIGNHEAIPPKSREQVLIAFKKWFDSDEIRKQREHDDKKDKTVKTYYHWIKDGIDFITLDNATQNEFDDAQLAWLNRTLDHARSSGDIRAVVVGMHEALPESLAKGHSMSSFPVEDKTGKQVYQWLLDFKLGSQKAVYILASHSHFYMDGAFQTDYWRQHGGVLPGWIIGTAGAERYTLPADFGQANEAKEHIYGYMVGTVTKDKKEPVRFEFTELQESDVLPKVIEQYTSNFVHDCWVNNPPPDLGNSSKK